MATEYQRAKRKAVYVTCSVIALVVFAVVQGLADRITNGAPL